MRLIVRSPITWVLVGLLAGFFAAAYYLPVDDLAVSLRAVQIALGLACTIAYGQGAVEIIRRGRLELSDHLILAIPLLAFAMALWGAWALLWRYAGRPDWMYQNDFNSFIVFLFCVSLFLALVAPGAIAGRIPSRNLIAVGASVGVAVFLAAFLFLTRPDARFIAEVLRRLGGF